MKNRIPIYALTVVFSTAMVALAEKPYEKTLEPVKNITRKVPGFWKAEIDCDGLPAGRNCIVRIPFVNPTNSEIEIVDGKSSCRCMRAKFESSTWKGGEEAFLELEIETPQINLKGYVNLSVVFNARSDGKPFKFIVGLRCVLSNILRFPEASRSFRVAQRNEIQEIALPFISTLDDAKYEVKITGNIVFDDATIEVKRPISFVRLKFDPSTISEDGNFGTVAISDSRSNRTDEIQVMVELQKSISLSPYILRARPNKNGYSAACFVRLHNEKDIGGALAISARLGDSHLKVKQSKLNDRIIKVEVQISDQIAQQQTQDVKFVAWDLVQKSRKSSLKSKIVFPDSPLSTKKGASRR